MNNLCRIIAVLFLFSLFLSCKSYTEQAPPSVPNSPEQVQELLRAARYGDEQRIREMIKAGVNINQIEEG